MLSTIGKACDVDWNGNGRISRSEISAATVLTANPKLWVEEPCLAVAMLIGSATAAVDEVKTTTAASIFVRDMRLPCLAVHIPVTVGDP